MVVDIKVGPASGLEQFTLLARSARGAGAAELVRQALEAPGVFVFGELLDAPSIQDLANTEHAGHLQLLNLFAFGTYQTLLQSPQGSLPQVTEGMRRKLRLLTIVTLAARSRLLPYALLLQELQMEGVRQLEDLVIDGICSGAVGGKLDQTKQHFEVDFVTGRDLRRADFGSITSVLSAWGADCDSVLAAIEQQVEKVQAEQAGRVVHKEELAARVEAVKERLKTQPELGEDPDSRMEVERGEKRKGGKGARTKKGGPWAFKM